jgi:hypothetical protein
MVHLLVQWLVLAFSVLVHPFYVSVVEVEHNVKNKSAEISVRVFTEDLEKALTQYHHTKIDLLHPANKSQTEAMLYAYVQKKLSLKIDGKWQTLKMIGYEQQAESIWTYLEIDNLNSCNEVAVKCDLLYEIEKSQINIIHVKNTKQTQSFKLAYPENTALFKLSH